jgi:2-iminobutanoate/2-iminopropanoate deaminase
MTMQRIDTPKAPKAIGAYSQGVKVAADSPLLFVSGQVPIDPVTGKLVEGDIVVLTRRVIDNLRAILEEGGSNLQQVVRMDIFLTNLKRDFAPMNEEYAKHFIGDIKPARQTVEVSNLPMGSPIEISCIAIVGRK